MTSRHETRHRRRVVLLAPIIAAALTACSNDPSGADATMHLQITASDSDDVVRINAAEDATATIPSALGGDFDVEVEVESMDGEMVELSTSEDLAPEGKTGGINLNDLTSEFTVRKGETLKLSTPTMDAGTTYAVTLEDGTVDSP